MLCRTSWSTPVIEPSPVPTSSASAARPSADVGAHELSAALVLVESTRDLVFVELRGLGVAGPLVEVPDECRLHRVVAQDVLGSGSDSLGDRSQLRTIES